MKTFEKPNIYEFLDVRGYLEEFYRFRKAQSDKFSYEIWANELGIKSRSLLRMVVLGQRQITSGFAETLSYGLGLKSAELKYFFLLIDYSRAKTKEQKSFFWKQMLPLLSASQQRTELSDPEFLSSHWLPKIQTILSFVDFEKTADNIGKTLGMEGEQALGYLQTLEKISSVKKEERSGQAPTWKSEIGSFKVPEAIQNSALKDYYLKSFEDAKMAIELPAASRKFRSLMIPLNEAEYTDLLARLEEVFQEVLVNYKSDELSGRRIYQFNTNLIPITKVIDESKSEIGI